MKFFPDQPPNFLAAYAAGISCYMAGMAMTVYDGLLSLVCQPFMALMFTSVAIVEMLVIGFPLLWWDRPWEWWLRHRWIPYGIAILSFASMAASILPVFQMAGEHPETGQIVYFPNMFMAIAGWHGLIFGVLYLPITPSRHGHRQARVLRA